MGRGDPQYDLEAMKRAIEQCDKNIAEFEKVIAKELETKMFYQRIVRQLEAKIKAEDEAKKKQAEQLQSQGE